MVNQRKRLENHDVFLVWLAVCFLGLIVILINGRPVEHTLVMQAGLESQVNQIDVGNDDDYAGNVP